MLSSISHVGALWIKVNKDDKACVDGRAVDGNFLIGVTEDVRSWYRAASAFAEGSGVGAAAGGCGGSTFATAGGGTGAGFVSFVFEHDAEPVSLAWRFTIRSSSDATSAALGRFFGSWFQARSINDQASSSIYTSVSPSWSRDDGLGGRRAFW